MRKEIDILETELLELFEKIKLQSKKIDEVKNNQTYKKILENEKLEILKKISEISKKYLDLGGK